MQTHKQKGNRIPSWGASSQGVEGHRPLSRHRHHGGRRLGLLRRHRRGLRLARGGQNRRRTRQLLLIPPLLHHPHQNATELGHRPERRGGFSWTNTVAHRLKGRILPRELSELDESFNKGEFIDSCSVQNSRSSGKPEGNNGADRRNRPRQGRLRGIRFGEKMRGKAKSFWSLGSRRAWVVLGLAWGRSSYDGAMEGRFGLSLSLSSQFFWIWSILSIYFIYLLSLLPLQTLYYRGEDDLNWADGFELIWILKGCTLQTHAVARLSLIVVPLKFEVWWKR